MLAAQDARPVLTVSALARQARLLIEEHFHLVWVEGEISNLRRPGSGHWYFTLKDDRAQLRCAMFAGRNRAVRFQPRDGTHVLIRGRVSLYEPRGDFQVVAEHMEPAGEGALRAAFEALKQRLAAEGLFDPERKRPLPALPRRLAVVSSPTGAALRDVLHVIERRFPPLEVVLLPVAVQGEHAEREVLAALERVPALDPDVVLVTRGGGSLEDLWTFNLERVARAVAACPVPVVSAVGHQTDVTITDFAADLRAPTPSAGAELITPDRADLDAALAQTRLRLQRGLLMDLKSRERHLRHLRARLTDPRARLIQQMQRVDELETRLLRALARRLDGCRRADELQTRLTRALQARLAACHGELATLRRSLALVSPQRRIADHRARLDALATTVAATAERTLARKGTDLAALARTLEAVSPLATLARGYGVLTHEPAPGTRTLLTSVHQTAPGDRLTAHLHDGALEVTVTAKDDDNRLPRLADPSRGDHDQDR